MKNQSDPRAKVFFGIAALLVLVGIIYILMGDSENESVQNGTPKLSISETKYDFGDISMSNGLAKHNFTIKNEGDGNLKISNLITSCMCTTVTLDLNGKKSPKFGMPGHLTKPYGWSQELKPGESASLEAIFDPLAHGPDATGPITREITITSNDDGKKDSQSVIVFSGNVTK